MTERDPATDPLHDIRRYPQDAQARQPGERLAAWRARRCDPDVDAPAQPGDDELVELAPTD